MMLVVPLLASLAVANQIPLHSTHDAVEQDKNDDLHSWLNGLPLTAAIVDTADSLFDATVDATKKLHDKVVEDLAHFTESKGHGGQSIYQVISENPHTSEFAKYVDKFPDLVDRLNDTDASQTLFVPINHAFEHIPRDKEPSKDVLEGILNYHVSPEEYSAKRVLSSHTIPTAFREGSLGDEPQRLRPGLNLHGANINFYSRIIKADIKTNNGVIHAVSHVLVPPPAVGIILNLLPSRFSTLLLAYEKTDFVKFVHGVKMTGSTMFAPSNKAFASLGPRANAFLFNTKKGRKYLTALLKYQIVPDVTLYSDHVSDKRDQKAQGHHELPTLLKDATLGVDVKNVWGFKVIRVNGFIDISLPDGIAKNGVLHQVEQLPLPPRKGHGASTDEPNFEVSVEELKERLEDYI